MEHGLPEPGDVIAGKYTVERTLGRGGMGAVYVVAHKLTGKRLALKCLLPEFVQNHDLVERFLREAQATGRIEHRNVVNVFDVGRDADVLYLVMELLDGKPLSDLLHDETLTLEEALAIIVRSMHGVAAAHAQGIVHRDLKPDNIFVCRGASDRLDDPRVLDFGISKLEDREGGRLTRSGVAMGTPYYMSLEQLSGLRDLDARVDVYAMGVILYEAISGVPPHTADSVAALAIRVLTVPPVSLNELRPDLPPGLGDVVMKAIARDRDERFPSMQALIDAIQPFIPQGAGLLVPEGQGRPLRTPRGATPVRTSAAPSPHGSQAARAASAHPDAASQRSRTPIIMASVGAGLVIAVAGVAALVLRGQIGPSAPAPAPVVQPAAGVAQPTPEPQALPPLKPVVATPAEEARAEAEATDAGTLPRRARAQGEERDSAQGPERSAPARSSKSAKAGAPLRPRRRLMASPPAAGDDSALQPSSSAPPVGPVPEQNKAPTTAQGRAGKLGSDDF